jgi:hypothetical protein
MSGWRNRITGSGTLLVDDALFHDLNWRIHTKEQQAVMEAVLDQVGWVQQIIISTNSGKLLDGHLRVTLADRRGEKELPCVFVDVTPAEERLILASLDPIGAMAVPDREKLSDLLEGIDREDATIDALARAVAEECDVPSDGPMPQSDETPHPTRAVTCPECGHVFDASAGG